MKKKLIILVTFLIILATTASANTIQIDGKASDWQSMPVFIQEERGDVPKFSKTIIDFGTAEERTVSHYNYDIVSIKMAADKDYVYLLIELADNILNYLEQHRENKGFGDNLCVITLDIDNDKTTGIPAGKGFWVKEGSGYEVQISIKEGYTSEQDNSEFLSCDVERYDEESRDFSYYSNRFMDYGIYYSDRDTIKNAEDIAFFENYLEIRMPQEIMSIKQGQEVRGILYEFADFAQSYSDKRPETEYSEEVIKQIW